MLLIITPSQTISYFAITDIDQLTRRNLCNSLLGFHQVRFTVFANQ